MPLLFVPLIMYASWMEMLTQPFGGSRRWADTRTDEEQATDARAGA
jgi:hypothetical protein